MFAGSEQNFPAAGFVCLRIQYRRNRSLYVKNRMPFICHKRLYAYGQNNREKDCAYFRVFCEENGIEQILCHAPYTLNTCSKDESIRIFARDTMKDDGICVSENTI